MRGKNEKDSEQIYIAGLCRILEKSECLTRYRPRI